MFRKVLFVLVLASAVGSFIYFSPFFEGQTEQPSFEDRLPKADFLGRCYLLDLARETTGMLFYNKIPFRDFFTQEFILSQGKNYGLNLQKPLYFFANEDGNWGVLVEVADSSKITPGIQRLKKILHLSDTLIYEQKTYKYEKESGYLTYDKNWIFLYKGNQFAQELKQILFAKKGGIAPCWKNFLAEKQFKNEKLVIYSNWRKLQEQGIEKAIFAHNSDSSSFSFSANRYFEIKVAVRPEIHTPKSTTFQMKIWTIFEFRKTKSTSKARPFCAEQLFFCANQQQIKRS